MMLAGAASGVPLLGRAQSGNKLTLYMGPPEKTCAAIAQGFEKKTGVKSTFLRLSAGEAINRSAPSAMHRRRASSTASACRRC